MSNLLFVYGTLKLGYHNSHWLEANDALYLDSVVTRDNYILGERGFPLAFKPETLPFVPDKYKLKVRGDLWEINDTCLAITDYIEGNGTFYTREVIKLDDEREAWMYLINDNWYARNCPISTINDQGEWEWSH